MEKKNNTIHLTRAERELCVRALESYAKHKPTPAKDKEASIQFIGTLEELIHGKGD